MDNYRTLAPDVCEQYTLPIMSVPVRLPKIGKLGALPTRDVIEMPEEQEETPAASRVLETFEQAILTEEPITNRAGNIDLSFPDIQKRATDTQINAAVYLDQIERQALASLIAHSRTPSQTSSHAVALFGEQSQPHY